eukprot:GHVT01073530.1.p2 GENE.GHVT01073530.1~~GHVT01073530.1.p2  ORF type:complete len:147 (-),score=32.88 GHVT01073530.1:469-909(-)
MGFSNEWKFSKGKGMDERQAKAKEGLFHLTSFFVCEEAEESNPENTKSDAQGIIDIKLVNALLTLGSATRATNFLRAEYIVVGNEVGRRAQAIRQQVAKRLEEEVHVTRGARYCSLVTPRYIFDCVLTWTLGRPDRAKGHVPFCGK